MTMHDKIQLRTPPHGDPLAAEARQLAIRAKLTSAYATDGSFRSSVNEVLAQTQHIADRAVDELLDELKDRDTKGKEEQPAQKKKARKPVLLMLACFVLPALAAGGIVAAIIEVMGWWRIAFGACHL